METEKKSGGGGGGGFPGEWDDDELVARNFAELPPSRSTNPRLWKAQLDFWHRCILSTQNHRSRQQQPPPPQPQERRQGSAESAAGGRRRLGFSLSELRERFSRDTPAGVLVPKHLGRVLGELISEGKLMYEWKAKGEANPSDRGVWAATVGSLASMMYNLTLGSTSSSSRGSGNAASSSSSPADNAILVLPEIVQRESKALHARMVKDALVRSDVIVPYDQLVKQGFAKEDLSVLLCTLKSQGLASEIHVPGSKQEYQRQHEQLCIHFATSTWPKPLPSDQYIAMFKLSERSLRAQVTRWSHQCRLRAEEAKACVRAKSSKAKCLSVLRRKRRAEKALSSAEKQLENVEIMRESLERVESDKALIGVFRKGSKYIGKVINEEGLTPEAVEKVLDDVRDAVEAGNVLGDALAEPVEDAEEEEDYDELFAELEREEAVSISLQQRQQQQQQPHRHHQADKEENKRAKQDQQPPVGVRVPVVPVVAEVVRPAMVVEEGGERKKHHIAQPQHQQQQQQQQAGRVRMTPAAATAAAAATTTKQLPPSGSSVERKKKAIVHS